MHITNTKAITYQEAIKPVQSGQTTAELMLTGVEHAKAIHWVTVKQLEATISHQPIHSVGFDIDDTVMFSSPGFNYGKTSYSPHNNSYLTKQQFWKHMNNDWDKFDIPKKTVFQLIQFYEKNGDAVYFITARPKTKQENLTKLLQNMLHIKNIRPIIFSGNANKSALIKRLHITTFYGDSDSDIASAKVAGAQGIRVMRAANSSYKPLPKNGDLGEEVLVNSQY